MGVVYVYGNLHWGGVSGLNWGGELFIFRGEISCGDVL